MALSPHQIASLAIWLTSARYLDPECCGCESADATKKVNAAVDVLSARVGVAELEVHAVDEIEFFLKETADNLAEFCRKYPSPPIANLEYAEHLLRELAECVGECGDGDGVASGERVPRCGFLDLAAAVERRVRGVLEQEARLPLKEAPLVQYVTALTVNSRDFAPFRLNGLANIKLSPRVVTIILEAARFTSRDLWHLAYTLHHELVCHAFQGAVSAGAENARSALPLVGRVDGYGCIRPRHELGRRHIKADQLVAVVRGRC